MRSRQKYILTKDEVHGHANYWLEKSLKLEYAGTKCTASTLLQILRIAAEGIKYASDFSDIVCRTTISTNRIKLIKQINTTCLSGGFKYHVKLCRGPSQELGN